MGVTPGSTLAQEIPTLIEGDLQRADADAVQLGIFLAKAVLLVDESLDASEDVVIVHSVRMLVCRPPGNHVRRPITTEEDRPWTCW